MATEHAGSAAATVSDIMTERNEEPSAASAGYALLDTHGKMIGADEMLQTPHRLLTSTPTTNRSEAMAKSSKRLVWDNYATDAWSATRGGKLLCRIRRGPKSGRWMLLRYVDGKAWLGDVAEWHSDYDSLMEAKAAARSL